MSEILSNTGVKLWSETDYNELWLTIFDQLTGQGGKSNIRLIDEAIGKINVALDGYKFEFSSDEDRLYISKGDSKLPVSLIDSNGHVATKVDGTTITIDESGVIKGVPVDDALSEESTNPLQNKVIAGELKSIKSKMGTDESAIKQNTSDITSNTKRIEANETAISTLNGTGDGSVKKAVSDGIAKVVAGAPEDFDTLKEMSDWIDSHESSASAMNSQIQDNKKAIDNHASNGDIHVTTENKTNWNKVSEKLDKTGDASNVTTEFTTATTRSNLTTKEKLSISFGKISKWFSDLKDVAFSGSYNDLNDKPASLPANGGNSTTVNGHTVNSDVPANAKFTDTTYGVATTTKTGIVKPDGSTITVDEDGTLHGVAKVTVDDTLSPTSTNPVQNKVVTSNLTDVRKETTVNLLKPTLETTTKNGVTCTNNGDGTYTLNGTATDGMFFDINTNISINKGTKYKVFSFKEGDYAPGKIMSGVRRIDTIDTYVMGNGSFVSDSEKCWLWLKIEKGITVSNLVCKPMLTTNLSATYEDFVPYTGDTGKLNGDVAELNKTVDALKKSVSDGKTKVANAITDKGVKTATDATFDVMAENISKIDTELHGATLAVSASDNELFGKTVTLTLNGANVGTTVLASNGTCSFVVQTPGTYTITSGEAHKDVTVTSDNVLNKTVISVELSLLKIVAFATGTDAEIAAMIKAHYNNKINIADYWAVGDIRTVHLSAMAAIHVGESHRAQDVQFVIGDFEHDDLRTPINGHSKAAVTLLQKDCLMDAANASNPVNGSEDTERGYINELSTTAGGWNECPRRAWCNNTYFTALPTIWQSMVKSVKKKASGGNTQTSIDITIDKVFLAAEIEIFGLTKYSAPGEGTQYQYYKNATANRYKLPRFSSDSGSVTSSYYERSPSVRSISEFCILDRMGGANTEYANDRRAIAPCLCI